LQGQIPRAITKEIDREIKEYIAYYEFVNNLDTEFMVLDFPNCIKDRGLFLKKVLSFIKPGEAPREMSGFEEFEEKMKHAEKSKSVVNGSFPNEIREKFKQQIRPIIQSTEYYQKANEIYSKISRNQANW